MAASGLAPDAGDNKADVIVLGARRQRAEASWVECPPSAKYRPVHRQVRKCRMAPANGGFRPGRDIRGAYGGGLFQRLRRRVGILRLGCVEALLEPVVGREKHVLDPCQIAAPVPPTVERGGDTDSYESAGIKGPVSARGKDTIGGAMLVRSRWI